MKRYFAIIAMLLSVFSLYAQEETKDYYFEHDGIRYKILSEAERTVETVSYHKQINNSPDTIVLPQKLLHNGTEYTLVKIGHSSFVKANISKIVLPTTVRAIDSQAFRQSKLSIIEGLDSVREFGFCAFGGSDIESIVFPDSIKSMDLHLFMLCHKLRRIELPAMSGAEYTMGACMFNNINPYEIKSNAVSPPSGAPLDHYLWEMYIPQITWIVVPAESINLYRNDNEWGKWGDKILPDNYALDTPLLFEYDGLFFSKFDDSDSLVTIVRPPKQFMEYPYGYGIGGTLTIPSKVTFQGKEYTVHAVGGFMDSEYEEIVLPPTVKVIDRLAFIHSKVKKINTENITEIRQQAFQGSALEEIKLPDGINLSLDGTFFECSKLTKVDLPTDLTLERNGNITDLEYTLFTDCINLSDLICRCPEPFAFTWNCERRYDSIFQIRDYSTEEYFHISPTVWVPKGSIDAYRETWGKYTDDFRELKEEPVKLDDITANSTATVRTSVGEVYISDVEGKRLTIASVSGAIIYHTNNAPEELNLQLPHGIYLLRVNGTTTKFTV